MEWERFFPEGTPVQALPDWQNPRLYLSGAGVRQRWVRSDLYPATRYFARLYRQAMRVKGAFRIGLLKYVPCGHCLAGFLEDVMPGAAPSVVRVGTIGPAQKMIIQLRDPEENVVGYLKYAEKPRAKDRVEREYHVLTKLPEGLGPCPLKYGSMGKGLALLVSAIPGKGLPGRLTPSANVMEYLDALVVGKPVAFECHPWIVELQKRVNLEERCLDALRGRAWAVVVHHGDFVPWNLIATTEGEVRAVDWEYGCVSGFPYLDLAYYILQFTALIRRWPPAKAIRYAISVLGGQSEFSLDSGQAMAILWLAAFHAYEEGIRDGVGGNTPLQLWRRAIWQSEHRDL